MLNKPTLFDEKVILETLFNYHENIRNKIINITIIGESNQVFAEAIIKYLLHVKKLSPYEVEELIRRYMVLFVYSLISTKMKDFNLRVPYFDKVLEGTINVEALNNNDIEDINAFTHLFLNTNKKDYLKNALEVKNKLDEYGIYNTKKNATIFNILRKENHYFTLNKDKFDNLFETNARNFDELIAETLVNDDFFKYEIHIDDDNMDAFNSNFKETKSLEDVRKVRKLLFGFLVYNALKDDNLDLTKPVKLIAPKYVKLYLMMKNATTMDKTGQSIISFVNTDLQGVNRVDFNKIIEFEFVFNNIKYKLTNSGIITL